MQELVHPTRVQVVVEVEIQAEELLYETRADSLPAVAEILAMFICPSCSSDVNAGARLAEVASLE